MLFSCGKWLGVCRTHICTHPRSHTLKYSHTQSHKPTLKLTSAPFLQVIVALTSKSRTHIPYRQTKLTNFLKDSLGGNCRTLMVACIWAEGRHLDETISTLQLAQRMMKASSAVVSYHDLCRCHMTCFVWAQGCFELSASVLQSQPALPSL